MLRVVSVGFVVLLGWIGVHTTAAAAAAAFVVPAPLLFATKRQTGISGSSYCAHIMPPSSSSSSSSPLALGAMVDPTSLMEATSSSTFMTETIVGHQASTTTSSMLLLAATEPWVQPLASVLDISLNIFSFAMLCRVVLSWYPNTKITDFPWIAVVLPTEPLLRAVKGVIPPAFGVDVTPVFWLAIFTFVHEILVGQQGLLTLKIKYGI